MPAALINVVSTQAPVLFISMIFGLQTVGLFSLSYQMLLLPVSLVSSSISQVFFGEMSDFYRKKSDQMISFYIDTNKNLFLFGAPLIILGSILSPLLFPIIFGEVWKGAGLFSLPLCPLVIALFVVSSTSGILELTGYNHWGLAWNISRTLMVIFVFYLALYYNFTPFITILLYSLIFTFMYIILFFLSIKAINNCIKGESIA
jgi:O-antigen/teichoic acid export membrane protein